MAFIDANGARLAYQQMGEGPDVILLHGLATNRAFWFGGHAGALVEAGFRVTLFDLRGHGYSTMSEKGYSVTALATDLLELMDGLHMHKAHIIGHSYGGSVALEFAVDHPARVSSLVVLDSRIHRLQPQQFLNDGVEPSAYERAVLEASPADWENETQLGLRYLEALARHTVAGTQFPSMGNWTPFGEGRGGKRTATQFVRLLDFTEASREFMVMGAPPARIQRQLAATPVMLAYGDNSRCLQSQKRLRELLPHALSERVAEAGHFFPATHAQHTRDMFAQWFAALNDDSRKLVL